MKNPLLANSAFLMQMLIGVDINEESMGDSSLMSYD